MEEFLKYLNEYNEKHTDSAWCESFVDFVLNNSEIEKDIEKLPISSEELSKIFEVVVDNVSMEFRIAHDIYLDDNFLGKVDYNTLTKYHDFFVKRIVDSILLANATKNVDLLKFCIENNLTDTMLQFNDSLFTLELLNNYKDFFIKWIMANIPNQEKYEPIRKNPINEIGLYDNKDFLIFCIENDIDEVVKFFLRSSNGIITSKLLEKYKGKFIDVISHTYSVYSTTDICIFKFALENNLMNNLGILSFNDDYYTKDILNQYKERFVKALSISYTHLKNNVDVLDFAFDNNINNLISEYLQKGLFFTKETFDRNREKAIEYFTNISDRLLDIDLKNNSDVLEFGLENGIKKIIDYYCRYSAKLVTDELLIKYGKSLKEYFANTEIPSLIRNNYKIIKIYIQNEIINVGMDKELAVYKLDYLYNINDEVLNNINFEILKYDFDLSFLSKITIYKDIQQKIIELDDKKTTILYRVAKIINNSSIDLSSILIKFLDNVDKYVGILDGADINELTDDQIENFLEMIIIDCSYGINNTDDLKKNKFSEKKKLYFNDFEKENHTVEEIQEAIFQKQYGIDLKSAKFILERYDYDFNELIKSGLDEKIITIIKGIKTIIECESVEKLNEIFTYGDQVQIDYHTFFVLESIIRQKYAEMYNKTYYQLNKDSKRCNYPFLQNVTYGGKPISFYEVEEDFAMQIHALGAYNPHYVKPDNFLEDWNRPKIVSHGFCTSYINNSEIATARAFHPILGFTGLDNSALLLGGNYDLNSSRANITFDISSYLPYKMLPPKAMIDATRHNHNEMVFERRRIKDNGTYSNTIKKMPNYVVYIVDSMEVKENFDMNNNIFNETLQAAADYNIPVVIIDRTKISKREMAKCQKMEREFQESQDLNILDELFLTYFNNNVGGRFFTTREEIKDNNLFNSRAVKAFYDRIVNYVVDEITDVSVQVEILTKIANILKREISNYEVSHHAERQEQPFDFEKEITNINSLIYMFKSKEQQELDKTNEELSSTITR